jgi:hypothetical protein
MKSMTFSHSHLTVLLAFIAMLALAPSATHAQRARTTTTTTQTESRSAQSATPTNPAPQSFKARYDGGVFGYNRKIDGTLAFDDAENRLVFRDKGNQVLFVVPYSTISAAFADTRSRRPTAARVVSGAVPYGLGLPALLIKNKYRYLNLQYRDSETERVGTTSFKLGNKQLLESVVATLAAKAELTRRGEIYVRPKPGQEPSTGVYEVATPPND